MVQPRGTWFRLAVQNFVPISARGWERDPRNGKNFHFLVKSRHAGMNPLTDFCSCYGLLWNWHEYAQLPCISVSQMRWFTSLVTELLLRNRASVIYPEIFCAPCRKNYALERKMIGTFLMMSTSSITMQSLGKIWTTCTGCRCENVVFVCFFVYHSPGSARSSFEGYNLNRYCVTVYGSILMLFSPFFFSFSIHMQYIVFIFVTSWHHNFREIVLDNC